LGWSFGGLLAYAVAAELRSVGEDISLLALLDTSFPGDFVEPGFPLNTEEVLINLIEQLGLPINHQSSTPAGLLDILRSHEHIFSELCDSDYLNMVGVINNNVALANTFVPEILNTNVHFVAAMQGRNTKSSHLWKRRLVGEFIVHEINCAHGDMMKPQVISEICNMLLRKL